MTISLPEVEKKIGFSMKMIAVVKGYRSWSLLLCAIYSPESMHKGQVVWGVIPIAPAQVFVLTLWHQWLWM